MYTKKTKINKFQKPQIGLLRKILVLSVTSLKIAKHRLQKQKEHFVFNNRFTRTTIKRPFLSIFVTGKTITSDP